MLLFFSNRVYRNLPVRSTLTLPGCTVRLAVNAIYGKLLQGVRLTRMDGAGEGFGGEYRAAFIGLWLPEPATADRWRTGLQLRQRMDFMSILLNRWCFPGPRRRRTRP